MFTKMRENICTIPVNEIFEQKNGCPLCRMRDKMEQRHVEYVTGPAMMEPDIRVEINKQGFCERHMRAILKVSSVRLPISLMLDSHLQEIDEKILRRRNLDRLSKLECDCFVCRDLDGNFSRHVETVYKTYRAESEFRALFAEQDYLCLPHYHLLATGAKKNLGKLSGEFLKECDRLAGKRVTELRRLLGLFHDSFDYRNAGKPTPEEARDSLERTAEFLSSRPPEKF